MNGGWNGGLYKRGGGFFVARYFRFATDDDDGRTEI